MVLHIKLDHSQLRTLPIYIFRLYTQGYDSIRCVSRESEKISVNSSGYQGPNPFEGHLDA